MRTKEQYYEQILRCREIAASREMTACPCRSLKCEWHGKCKECVAIHRHNKDHLPICLQPVIAEQIKALAHNIELVTAPREPTSAEFKDYVREMDARG